MGESAKLTKMLMTLIVKYQAQAIAHKAAIGAALRGCDNFMVKPCAAALDKLA
jgi:hypothetical protein